MKKILSLLLALLLLPTLISCINGGEEESRKTVEGFLDCIVSLDIDGAKAYIDDASMVDDVFEDFNLESIYEDVPSEFQKYSDGFNSIIDLTLEKITSVMSYEIRESTKKDGKFSFLVDITYVDDDMDIEELFSQKFTGDAALNIATELIADGKITETSTEEEILDAVMPKVFEIATEIIEETEFQTKTDTCEIIVVEKDGKWLISAEESDL